MNGIDTNILIYSVDEDEPVKRPKAQKLLRRLRKRRSETMLLWQVIAEFVRQLRTWLHQGALAKKDVRVLTQRYLGYFPLIMPTPAVLHRALDLADKYSLSHWDSMLLGACLEAGIDTLYTEDMGAPRTIEGVKLVNPFV